MTIDQGLKACIVTQEDRDAARIAYTNFGIRRSHKDALEFLADRFARHRLAARTPSPSLPSREAIALIVRETLTVRRDTGPFPPGEYDLLFIGCTHAGYGYPEADARDFANLIADAILSLLPVNGWMEGFERAREAAGDIAEAINSGRGNESEIAKAIRALSAAPGEGAATRE